MKKIFATAALAGLMALAACGQETPQAENVQAATEMRADNLEDMADNATTEAAEDALENKADVVRDAGQNQAAAIDAAAENGASNATLNAMANAN